LTGHGCQIAPRTFYAWASRAPSKRALWDTAITGVLAGYYQPDQDGKRKPESLYGSVKMWAHLRREGIEVARCTVERGDAGQRLAGRVDGIVLDHNVHRGNPADAPLLAPAITRIAGLLGRTRGRSPPTAATAKPPPTRN
jgi:hypothetical protein